MSLIKKSIFLLLAAASTGAMATYYNKPADPSGPSKAETIMFTNSNLVNLPSGMTTGTGSLSSCMDPRTGVTGTCAPSLKFETVSGGTLTVKAGDGPDKDTLAYVFQGGGSTGLGVVEGYKKDKYFKITDTNYSLDTYKESLTLSFSSKIKLENVYFFADDRFNTLKELDSWDGFTLSVDGGAFKEFSSGKNAGLPTYLGLEGSSFTFSYANKLSGEDYFIGGVSISPAIPEPSTYLLMGLGLVGLIAVKKSKK